MFSLFIKIHHRIFKITTNSLYVYNILKMELLFEKDCFEYEKEIVIKYIPLEQLYQKHIHDERIHTYHEPIILTKRQVSTMIITSVSDVYSIRAFITREILEYLYSLGNYLALHSAVVVTENNKGILFSGEKNSGKSSMSLASTLCSNAGLVSDDITILYIEDNKIVTEGIFKGINADDQTANILKTGIGKSTNLPAVKERYIINEMFYKKHAQITVACFSCVAKTTKSVCIKRINKKTFYDEFQANLIRTFFGQRMEIEPYFLLDMMDIMFSSTDIYKVKLKDHIIDSHYELKELIYKRKRKNKC